MDLEKEHDPLRQTSKEIVRKLKLLANSHRIEILLMLMQREHCMDEMARKLKARKSAVSYHLMMLEKNGMICKTDRSNFFEIFIRVLLPESHYNMQCLK